MLRRGARVHDAGDGFDEAVPAARLDREMLATKRGERVEPRATIIVGYSPRTLDPLALLQSLERGIEGPVVDEERVSRSCLDCDGDAVAVVRPKGQDAEDEQIERSLEEGVSRRVCSSGHSTRVLQRSSRMST